MLPTRLTGVDRDVHTLGKRNDPVVTCTRASSSRAAITWKSGFRKGAYTCTALYKLKESAPADVIDRCGCAPSAITVPKPAYK
jgi:hypothetical protein